MLGSGKELLAFLRAKAKETGMWILWSSALLSEAKLGLANGESIATALESMVRSSQIIVEKNVKTMLGPQFHLVIAVWDRLGIAALSNITREVFLRCHAHTSVLDDHLRLTCRTAGMLASKGNYTAAFTTLESIDPNALRSSKPAQHHRLTSGLLALRRALHHNNLPSASHLLSQLLQNTPDDIDPDTLFLIHTLHIESLTRHQDYASASTKIESLLAQTRAQPTRDAALLIHLLLLKAHLYDLTGRPERGFTVAMRAASMAWRARLVALLWQAVGALANVLNALGEFAAAERLLVAVLPRCLEGDGVYLAGVLWGLLGDARVGMVGEGVRKGGGGGEGVRGRRDGEGDSKSDSERGEMMRGVHRALDRAFECFEAVEDVKKRCEVMAKKAALYRAEGEFGRADECAEKYLRLVGEGAGAG
jgi:anaphase-promoting complex subunit 5